MDGEFCVELGNEEFFKIKSVWLEMYREKTYRASARNAKLIMVPYIF